MTPQSFKAFNTGQEMNDKGRNLPGTMVSDVSTDASFMVFGVWLSLQRLMACYEHCTTQWLGRLRLPA